MDWTQQIVQAIRLGEFNGYNLMEYTYNGSYSVLTPTTRTPVLDQLIAGSPDDYCYDRTSGDPYWGSITVGFTERTVGFSPVGDVYYGDYLKIEFEYTSNVVFYCTIDIQKGTGQPASDPVYVELPANAGTGTVTEYISITALTASDYQLFIKFYSSTVDADAEFCFSNLSVKNMSIVGDPLQAIKFIDCYGDEEVVSFTSEKYDDVEVVTLQMYDDNNLGYFEIRSTLNTNILPVNSTYLFSNWFMPIDPATYGDCKLGSLLRIDWTQTCMYVAGDAQQSIDYNFYLRGYVQRIARELRERQYFIDSEGVGINAYSSTVGKAEIVINYPYSEWVHEILESATESNTFFVNDQHYRPDASNIWTLAGNDNGTYSGRIEMCIGDSEKIHSICCCPVAEPDYSPCGDLAITDICIVAGQRLIRYELSGAVNATSIDVQFENLEAIEDSPCDTPINTTFIESAVSSIGVVNSVVFSSAEWTTVFDDNYCGITDIQYNIRLRTNCGDGNVGAWSEPFTIVPDNLEVCD
jgi:hypothetical protein